MRYFITLSYDGAAYHGWQIQPNGNSIQETLQKALSTILRDNIEIVGAGRTDTGVNASKMVAHFDTDKLFDALYRKKELIRLSPEEIKRLPQNKNINHISGKIIFINIIHFSDIIR